jgi:hypothetical protein
MTVYRGAAVLAAVALLGVSTLPANAQNVGQTYRVVYDCTDFASCWASCSIPGTTGETGAAEQAIRSRDLVDPQLQFRFVQIERVFWGDDPAYLNPPLAGPVMVRFMWSTVPVPDKATDPAGYYVVSHEASLVFFDADLLNCQFNNMTVVQF